MFDRSLDNAKIIPWEWPNLRSVTKAQSVLETAIAACGGQIAIPKLFHSVGIWPQGHAVQKSAFLYLEVWIGNASFDLMIDSDAAQEILKRAGFHEDITRLSSRDLAYTAELILAPILQRYEKLLGGDVVIMGAGLSQVYPSHEGLACALLGRAHKPYPLYISGYRDHLLAILQDLRSCDALADHTVKWIKYSHRVSYRSEPFRIDKSEIEALQSGDGIMLPDSPQPPQIAFAVINNHLNMPVTITVDGLEISDMPKAMKDHLGMTNTPELYVELSLEIASTRISPDDLKDVFQGAILPFPEKIGSQVTLLCNGQRVAGGEIVDVDGVFGVRICEVS